MLRFSQNLCASIHPTNLSQFISRNCFGAPVPGIGCPCIFSSEDLGATKFISGTHDAHNLADIIAAVYVFQNLIVRKEAICAANIFASYSIR